MNSKLFSPLPILIYPQERSHGGALGDGMGGGQLGLAAASVGRGTRAAGGDARAGGGGGSQQGEVEGGGKRELSLWKNPCFGKVKFCPRSEFYKNICM